jgi:ADP-ribosylglycohydrolase
MLGAIIGDIVGSIYEFDNHRSVDFPFFSPKCFYTDDSILTIALADAILNDSDYTTLLKEYTHRYPGRGYGGGFQRWALTTNREPYNSFGNGAAMRISPVGWAFDNLPDVLAAAEKYTTVTHNHSEGINGGQATAAAVFLARNGKSKEEIRAYVTHTFGYDLSRTCDEIRPVYTFNETCQQTVPEAIIAFLESTDFESAIRLAISLGGDSDTLACITGGIAEAFYGGVPAWMAEHALGMLSPQLKEVTEQFREKFGMHNQ